MTFTNTTDEDKGYPRFRLIQGGKQPPDNGDRWVGKLKMYTRFTAFNRKLSDHELFLYEVREKYANTIVLTLLSPCPEPMTRFFCIEGFSKAYELRDIIDDPGENTDYDRRMEGSQVLAQSDADIAEGID